MVWKKKNKLEKGEIAQNCTEKNSMGKEKRS